MASIGNRVLSFKKGPGKTDSLEFQINGKSFVDLMNPKKGIIPHDMVHYVIEKSFGFEGFVLLVFKGHNPGKVMEVLHGVVPKLSGEYSKISWITESLVEAFQSSLWSAGSTFQDFEYLYKKACEARSILAEKIEENSYLKANELAKDLTTRWN
jgi:hypothetical protein